MSIKDRIAKLIDIKSIITIISTGVFSYLSIVGRISEQQFVTIFMMIAAFYFGTQSQKKKDESNA